MIENIRALDAFSAPRTIKENDGYFAAQCRSWLMFIGADAGV
jgi:hypothetical protein